MRKTTRADGTRISDKGQITLPKLLRERRGWTGGTEFFVEERLDGVFLRPAVAEAPAEVDETFGRLRRVSNVITIDDMHEAVLEEARQLWSKTTEGGDG
jgi:AbrB family looped-hinge helix DNA binding protein